MNDFSDNNPIAPSPLGPACVKAGVVVRGTYQISPHPSSGEIS